MILLSLPLPPGAACTVLLIYMFCTDCWLIAAVYTAWLIFDWNTPKQGNAPQMSIKSDGYVMVLSLTRWADVDEVWIQGASL